MLRAKRTSRGSPNKTAGQDVMSAPPPAESAAVNRSTLKCPGRRKSGPGHSAEHPRKTDTPGPAIPAVLLNARGGARYPFDWRARRINFRKQGGSDAVIQEKTVHTVLFLCTGNFYRSRFAEIYFNWLAPREKLLWRADSRGLALDPTNFGPLSI